MTDKTPQPDAPEEAEHRLQEVRAQQMRAVLLFHGYSFTEDDDVDADDDATWND